MMPTSKKQHPEGLPCILLAKMVIFAVSIPMRHEPMHIKDDFLVEILGSSPDFWRYNIAVACGCFAPDGSRCDFVSAEDTVAPAGSGLQSPPANYVLPRVVKLAAPSCHSLLMYVYVIPHALPEDNSIEHSLPFDMTVSATRGGRKVYSRIFKINRWAGASLEIRIPELHDGDA